MKITEETLHTDWQLTKHVLTGMQHGLNEAGHYETPITPMIPVQDQDVQYVLTHMLEPVNTMLVELHPEPLGSIQHYIAMIYFHSGKTIGLDIYVHADTPERNMLKVLFAGWDNTLYSAIGSASTMFLFAAHHAPMETVFDRLFSVFQSAHPDYLIHDFSESTPDDHMEFQSWMYWVMLYALYTAIHSLRDRGVLSQDMSWEWLAPILCQEWMHQLTDRTVHDTIWQHMTEREQS